MRRTILVAAMALVVLALVASPAAARSAKLGPIVRLDCTVSGGDVYWARLDPARSGVPGWNYYTDDVKPFVVLMFYGTVYGNQPVDNLTLCSIHLPVFPGTDTYDSSLGLPEEEADAYFLFL